MTATPPRTEMPAESVPVTLARMEGTINLVLFQITAVSGRVDHHDDEIQANGVRLGLLELAVQGLSDGMVARDRTAIEKAQALKDAKDAQEATARAETIKSDQTWSPIAKLFAVITTVGVLFAIYAAMNGGGI